MKFEYKTITFKTEGIFGGKVNTNDFEAMLNRLGAEGWELVNSLPSAEAYGKTIGIVSIFKRVIQ